MERKQFTYAISTDLSRQIISALLFFIMSMTFLVKYPLERIMEGFKG
jgi:hypothetical protein